MEPLKLVVPISNFLCKCEAIWASIISQIQNDAKTVGSSNHGDHLSCEGVSNCRMIRRIISSEDLGLIMMGTLEISPSSGRLQLVDSTGSVDVVVPDLLSNIDGHSIHEVKHYKLVLEGVPKQLVSVGFHFNEPFSLKSIFQQFPYTKASNQVRIYVHYYLRDSTCIGISSCLPACKVMCPDLRGCSGGAFHLLLVTHKFPDNESDVPKLSNRSSLFAEALVLPYTLILPEEYGCNKLAQKFQGMLKAHVTSRLSHNLERQQVPERELSRNSKLKVTSRLFLSDSKCNSEEVERWPSQIPCFLTLTSDNLEEFSVPAYLCHTDISASENITDNHCTRRILLEFKSDSICKYQFLHLGAYYILRCSRDGLLCNAVGCENVNCGKALVDSQATIWSLSFSCVENMHHSEPPLDDSSEGSSAGVCETVSRNCCQDELIFRQSSSGVGGASDVYLHFSSEAAGLMKEEIEAVEDGLIRLLSATNVVLSVSSCIQMMDELARPFTVVDQWGKKLPQGNLISLCGNIENIHNYSCKSISYVKSEPSDINQRKPCSLCIHVYDDHHMVRIFGDLSKYTHLVGMGPGANATFHRVLMTCSSRCRKLVLTPVSYVVINSVKESGHQHIEKGLLTPFGFNNLKKESLDMVSLALTPKLVQCLDGTLARFHCRVVTINILVLEKHLSKDFDKSQSRLQLKMPRTNISLAGFVLDDGSSLCCCWADAGRAETLLRLHETSYQASFSGHKRSKKERSKRSQDTIVYQLDRILKKHNRVVVRNHGAVADSYCQDFTFSVDSDKIFSNSEENLLRFIVLNACGGPTFNVVGCMMDSNALELMDTQHVELQLLKNVCVREVGYVNPLTEARDMLDALVAR